MRKILSLITLVFSNVAYASDPLPEPTLPDESIQSVLNDANEEFQMLEQERLKLPKVSSETLPLGDKPPKDPTLTELAAQVDALRNKLIVEKTTLLATQTPRKVKVSGAKTIFNFRDNAVFEVTSSVDHVTDIQLKPGEEITSPPTAGDTVRWSIAVMKSGTGLRQMTHLIIKPLDENVTTNLVVTTDQRVYQVNLVSGEFHMPVVSWTYPEDFEEATKLAVKRSESQEPTLSPENLHFNYKLSGDNVPWKPVRVFDDGSKTFIQLSPEVKSSEAPALFLIEDGEPLLVNYRLKGSYYIVDRVFTRAELRVGPDSTVTIEVDDGRNWFERNFL